jgi:hypothetical protein
VPLWVPLVELPMEAELQDTLTGEVIEKWSKRLVIRMDETHGKIRK